MNKFSVSSILALSLSLAACSNKDKTAETQDVAVEQTNAAPADMAEDAVAGAESDADAMGEMNSDAMREGVPGDGAAPSGEAATPAAE